LHVGQHSLDLDSSQVQAMRPLARIGVKLGQPLGPAAGLGHLIAKAVRRLELEAFGRNVAVRKTACPQDMQRPRDIGADLIV
jgi:hypothetical protein